MRLVWTRKALSDLSNIRNFIAKDSPSAAYRVTRLLRQRTRILLTQAPRSGRAGAFAGTRELIFPTLPYIVVYKIEAEIVVLSVRHASRDWP